MEYYHSAQVSVPTEYFAIKELNCRKFLDFEALLKFGQDQIGKWKASKFAAGHPDKNSSTITDVKQPELNQQSVGYQQDLVQNKSTRYFLNLKDVETRVFSPTTYTQGEDRPRAGPESGPEDLEQQPQQLPPNPRAAAAAGKQKRKASESSAAAAGSEQLDGSNGAKRQTRGSHQF